VVVTSSDRCLLVVRSLCAGTGTFGRVRIVLHKETRKYMALKILKKSEVSAAATAAAAAGL
jgi:serine/threonine protein kinase